MLSRGGLIVIHLCSEALGCIHNLPVAQQQQLLIFVQCVLQSPLVCVHLSLASSTFECVWYNSISVSYPQFSSAMASVRPAFRLLRPPFFQQSYAYRRPGADFFRPRFAPTASTRHVSDGAPPPEPALRDPRRPSPQDAPNSVRACECVSV